MPYTLKKNKFKYKNPDTGNYEGVDVVAERSFADYQSALETVGLQQQTVVRSEGTTQKNAVTAAGTAAVANFPATAAACDTLAGDFAATYVPDQAYAVGDYCTYQYQLYQCKTAIAINTDHTFVASHWNLITVTDTINDQVDDLKTQFDDVTTTTGGTEVLDTSENLATSLSRGYYTTVSGTMAFNNSNANFSNMKIPVTPGTKYQINKTHNIYDMSSFNALGVFFDAGGNYINTIAGAYGGIPTEEPYDVIAPENSAMMYLSTDYVYTASNVETTVYKYIYTGALFLDSGKLSIPPVYFSEIAATGKKIKIIAGVVRNTGDGWQYINDSGHEPLNLIRVKVDANGKLQIDYGFTAKKVLSLIAAPDETFAKIYTIGGSVGLDKTLFSIYSIPRIIGGRAVLSNNTITVSNSDFTSGSFDTTTGEIKLYHEDISALPATQKFNISAICNTLGYSVRAGSQGNDYISLYLVDNTGAIIKDTTGITVNIFANRLINAILMNAADIANASGNFWIYGVMEVE